MNILIFGAQGSGKSTHGEYIASKLNIPYIYTGDLFRELEKENSERGERIRKLMIKGVLIPDELAIPAFEEYLDKFNIDNGLVLDGFPRTIKQARSLPIDIDLIIYITLPIKIAVERLMERGRYDDTRGSIEKRLALFKEKTKPVLTFYREKGVNIAEVDNSPSIDEVGKRIDGLLEK